MFKLSVIIRSFLRPVEMLKWVVEITTTTNLTPELETV